MKKVFSLIALLLVIVAGSLGNTVSAQQLSTEVHWSQEKEAIYDPLLNQTLLWYDDIMKLGGFDFETETIVKDAAKADVVMNSYTDIGARKIVKIATFAKPISKNSIVFPTDGLGYTLTSMEMKEGEIFLIQGSDGKFIQIRIDRIESSKVYFTYAVEADVPVMEDVTNYDSMGQKYTRDTMKVWTISFSQPVDGKTVNNSTIYVKDSKGYLVETNVTMSFDDKKVYVAPVKPYKSDEKYTIYITKEIKNKSGKYIKKGAFMSWLLDSKGTYPDKTEPQQLFGLNTFNVSGKVRLSWYASSANDLAGYRIYYRIKGEKSFQQLLKDNRDGLYYSPEAELTGIQNVQGKTVEFYVTAVDKSGNESIPSALATFTFDNENSDPDPQYSQYYGEWKLELAYVPFGNLQVFEDGSYRWIGGPNGASSGAWEVRDYGFVLVNADGGEDYVIERSNKNPSGIKLLTVTDGTYNDGSPILIYFCDGK